MLDSNLNWPNTFCNATTSQRIARKFLTTPPTVKREIKKRAVEKIWLWQWSVIVWERKNQSWLDVGILFKHHYKCSISSYSQRKTKTHRDARKRTQERVNGWSKLRDWHTYIQCSAAYAHVNARIKVHTTMCNWRRRRMKNKKNYLLH